MFRAVGEQPSLWESPGLGRVLGVAGNLPIYAYRMPMSPTTARRAYQALRMRDQGVTFRQIGAELGCSHVRAQQLVDLAIREMLTGSAYAEREAQVRRLDQLSAVMWSVLRAPHYVVSGRDGAVVLWDGEPLVDDAPRIRAAETIVKIEARRAKLLGLDTPVRTDQITVTALDAELERLTAELGEEGQRIRLAFDAAAADLAADIEDEDGPG